MAQAEEDTILRHLAPSTLAQELQAPQAAAPALDRAPAAGALELTQAVRQAVSRHPSITDAIATLSQQSGGVAIARAGYFPKLQMGLGGGTNNGSSSSDNGTLASASVSQMLYDFGKVSGAVSRSEAEVRRQQSTVLKQIDSIAQQTADAVVMLHRYQALEEIARNQVEAVEKVFGLSQLRANAGLSTKADPIQAESRVDSARANLLQVTYSYTQWRERLRTLLGGPVPKVIAPLPEKLVSTLRLDTAPDAGLLPDVLIAQADRRAAVALLEVANAQRYPTVSLDASINKALGGNNPSTAQHNGTYHTVMLNLSSVLYQGGAINGQIRAATAAEEAARQRIEVAQLNASDVTRSIREQAAGAQARIGVLAARKRSILAARDLYREQYTLGTRSILDLLNAEQEIHQAAADEESVLHDFWQSRIAYVGATGQSREFYGLNNTNVQGMELLP